MRQGFRLSGHRGARALWPENTLCGFAGVMALGVNAIELDVRLCAGGTVVVTHDRCLHPDLTRDAGGCWLEPPTPEVAALTLPELRQFDVGYLRPGSALAATYPRQQAANGSRIPTFREVLSLVAGGGIGLDIELKSDAEDGRDDDGSMVVALAEAVAMELESARGESHCMVRSFDWRALAHWRRSRPASPLAFLTEAPSEAVLPDVLSTALPGDTWAPHHQTLSAESSAAARGRGLRIEPWTVNDPADMRRVAGLGVDGFCTDAPDVAKALLRTL